MRKRFYARRPSPHERDETAEVVVRKLLTKLAKASDKLQWAATRISDIMWLETVESGLCIKLSLTVTQDDVNFLRPGSLMGMATGRRPGPEVVVAITDHQQRWGRGPVVRECFAVESPLFEQARALFFKIAGEREFIWIKKDRKRRTYPQCVRAVTKLLP